MYNANWLECPEIYNANLLEGPQGIRSLPSDHIESNLWKLKWKQIVIYFKIKTKNMHSKIIPLERQKKFKENFPDTLF